MYFSLQRFTGTGSQTQWEFNFAGGYIEQAHIKVQVTSALGVVTAPAFTWVGPNTISISPAVASGSELEIYRDTPKDVPLVDYTDGAIIGEKNLDKTAEQTVFATAEIFDRLVDVQAESLTAFTTANAASATATSALALANQAVTTADATGNAAAEASASASSAAASAASASASATSASASATSATNSKNAAAASATSASASATSASASSASAAASRDSATASATSASASRVAAEAAATDAQEAAGSASLIVAAGLGFTASTAYDFGFITDALTLFPTDLGTLT